MAKALFAVALAGAVIGAVGGLALFVLKKAPVVGPFLSRFNA